MVELIMSNSKVDLDLVDTYGVNAFWIAAFFGHADVMRILIQNKISITSKN